MNIKIDNTLGHGGYTDRMRIDGTRSLLMNYAIDGSGRGVWWAPCFLGFLFECLIQLLSHTDEEPVCAVACHERDRHWNTIAHAKWNAQLAKPRQTSDWQKWKCSCPEVLQSRSFHAQLRWRTRNCWDRKDSIILQPEYMSVRDHPNTAMLMVICHSALLFDLKMQHVQKNYPISKYFDKSRKCRLEFSPQSMKILHGSIFWCNGFVHSLTDSWA